MLGRLEIKDWPVSTAGFQKEEGLELEPVTQPPSTPLLARPGLQKGLVCPQCLLSFVEDQSTKSSKNQSLHDQVRPTPGQAAASTGAEGEEAQPATTTASRMALGASKLGNEAQMLPAELWSLSTFLQNMSTLCCHASGFLENWGLRVWRRWRPQELQCLHHMNAT